MTSLVKGRALHWVFKIGNRSKTMDFYRNILGMKILRHEEFKEGCEAACNGPYDGQWSKTMVGYGPEDSHFVVELTYNYGIGSYKLGNDFQGITIKSSKAIKQAQEASYPLKDLGNGSFQIQAPDGYPFVIRPEDVADGQDPVEKVSLSSTSIPRSLEFWKDVLNMAEISSDQSKALLQFDDNQAQLELIAQDNIDRGSAYGRIAFAVPADSLPGIQKKVESIGLGEILKPLVELDTPGKASVHVVILSDPDQTEICFVGDEAFRELSQVDPEADNLLNKAMEEDKSGEYFEKKGRTKPSA
ncbi:hypothetical protein TCAL_01956 [Tigriopus californicus]|uniref:VOC domain-containing protein n=1 Tax=Tigriopus californicus TaxID=6832 RepID=A0A553P698_TIGCA|nr:glyoxalase domain-containing protein 4-like [Tigriopus californicus]TRY73215.1 hypothetical protein TCAL_01956 [Tigriopus californicus]|eukprot:TCALIF_01956-PA protein Name:"Similar to Glod4 Glyoxalase domain-containing protein 4 (Mus musculus)" AED:0.03 eAED:0.03 QI:298/1/1/1/1/1/3/101/300